MVNIRKFLQGIGLIPVTVSTIDTKGEMEVLSASGKLNYFNGTSASPMVTEAHTATLTNKSMDGGSNTFTNLPGTAISGQVPVANGGTGASSLTSNGVVIGNGTSAVTVTAEGATNTVLHGNTGADPSFSAVSLTADVSGVLPVANGGTGDNTLTSHGVLIGQGTSAVAATAAGTSGQPLLSGGASADPAYGTLSVSFGGTGDTTLTNHGVLLGQGTSAIAVTSVGATGTVLHGNTGADPSFSAVSLTADVSGVLPAANVGLVRTINAQTGTTYTFVLGDGSAAGGNPLVTASNASAQTYTVPPNSSVAFPTGTQIDVLQLGAGKVTLAQGSGVTINSKASNKAIGAQYVGVTLIKTGTDVWELLGDLIA